MDNSSLDAVLEWIGRHPLAAGLVVFAIAFFDALVIVGVAVPAVPLLFGVGTLVGLGLVDGVYATLCAGLGAFCGDGVSYVLGRMHGDRLRRMWPFSRHPTWLASGEQFFARRGLKGILIARYVGAVRPFVPAIAGMLKMPVRRYVPASLLASFSWGACFVLPGWVFGASIDLFSAVAGRLAIVLGVLLALLALIWFTVRWTYNALAPHAAGLLQRAFAWSHRHPLLGRFSGALIDPRRRESVSLLTLAMLLIGTAWAFFTLLIAVLGNGRALPLDLAVHHGLFALRTPLADHLMALLAAFGDWQTLAPASLLVFMWLLWRRRLVAAWHWLAAIGFGLVLVAVLGFLLDVPKPPASMAVPGFSFPSAPVTMATVVYGFFAVLVARELPGRRRAWPYVVAGLLVTQVGFARLYFGAHWLSDVVSGVLLGLAWTALLGIAYRRRVDRSFWSRPVSALFFISIAVAGVWHGSRSADATLQRFEVPIVVQPVELQQWRESAWQQLPERRNDFSSERAWPLNLQYAGDLRVLTDALAQAGFRPSPDDSWKALLRALDKDASPENLPVLPAAHNGRGEVLQLSRPGATPDTRIVLRLWPSELQLQPGGQAIWQGTVAQIAFTQRYRILSLWVVDDDFDAARDLLAGEVGGRLDGRIERVSTAADGATLLLRQLRPDEAGRRQPVPAAAADPAPAD